jgi:hypothetical protein
VQFCYWLAELKFPIVVQRRFRDRNLHTTVKWHKRLLETGSLLRSNEVVSADRVDTVSESDQRASRELCILKSTVHDIVHKRLWL